MSQQFERSSPSPAALMLAIVLGGLGYLLGGPVRRWVAIDVDALGAASIALYLASAVLLAAEALPWIWRLTRREGSLPVVTDIALRGIGGSLAVFALIRSLPVLSRVTTPSPTTTAALALVEPYLGPLSGLSYAVLLASVAYSLHRASTVFWRPIPVRAAVEAFVLAIAVRYLLDPMGPITVRTGLDLTFFAWPFWLGAAGYTAFWLVRLARVSRVAHTSAALALWLSLAVAAYLAFHLLSYLAVELAISERYRAAGERALPYLSLVAGVDRWAIAGILVLGLERATSGYTARWLQRRLGPLIRAARSLTLGVIVWGAAQHLGPLGPLADVAGVVGFAAFAAVAAGDAARLLTGQRGTFGDAIAWFTASHFRNANIGALIALYAVVVRPALYESTGYAALIEWLGLALPTAYLIARAAGGVASQTRNPPDRPAWREWRRHEQNASLLPDRPVLRVAAIHEGYIESGEASGLAVRITTAMAAAARPVDEVLEAVRPVVNASHGEGRPGRTLAGMFPRRSSATRARDARWKATQAMEQTIRNVVDGSRTPGVRSLDSDALWTEARRAFVERGDRVHLAVSFTMLAWHSGATREVLTTQFGRIVQYRDARPRWYDLPSARRRSAELVPAFRAGFADELRPSLAAGRTR